MLSKLGLYLHEVSIKILLNRYQGLVYIVQMYNMKNTLIEFDGYCPESNLKGKKIEMKLNEMDFRESEKTGLKI